MFGATQSWRNAGGESNYNVTGGGFQAISAKLAEWLFFVNAKLGSALPNDKRVFVLRVALLVCAQLVLQNSVKALKCSRQLHLKLS